ncbi:MAG: chemotaxis protein CheB [Silvanigrellaceae bacterium]
MKTHYLFPGQLVVYQEPCMVTTILGSCVAIAMFDPVERIAGLNHFLLPNPSTTGGASSPRYGSVSTPMMLDQLLAAGAVPERLQAKIFGGARVLDDLNLGESIGRQNVEFAKSFLASRRIPVVEEQTGGNVGRKIILDTSNFNVTHQLMGGHSKVSLSGVESSLLTRTVRVVVVDDSASVRTVFSRVLDQSGRVKVVGAARDAFEAREVIVKENPDVILLDIEMPGMSGVKFLEKLMQHFPIPTIMVSSLNPEDDAAVRALEIGALEFVHKPDQFDPATLRFFAEHLVQKVVAAASSADRVKSAKRAPGNVSHASASNASALSGGIEMILVGGNGGAHSELEQFLSSLPNDTPPVLVAVSSVSEHLKVFINKWKVNCRVQIKEAVDGLVPMRGCVYISPARRHLSLENRGGQTVMCLRDGPPVCLQTPSSEVLFDSASKSLSEKQFQGLVAVLLSGFGSDGVQALLRLREKGTRTLVTHPESSVFAFAPKAAIEAGAADEVLLPEEFAKALMKLRSRAAV